MKPKTIFLKILKLLLVVLCTVLDFYALGWLESFFFDKYDNPLRYFAPIYIPYISVFIVVFIYLLTVGIRWIFGKCKRQILLVFLFAVFGASVLYMETREERKYTVQSSEERINGLVSTIEKNLEGTSVLQDFMEEQEAWKLYRRRHIETLFPEEIDDVKMPWGSVSAKEAGDAVLLLNIDRIKTLEAYLDRSGESGTDGRGDFKEYVEELKRLRQDKNTDSEESER